MKRKWLTIGISAVFVIVVCLITFVWGFRTWLCDGEIALRDMDHVLKFAYGDQVFTVSPHETAYRMWMNLHQLLTEARGNYDLVLLGLEQVSTPGDDATVGARLATGVNLVCIFYNHMVQSCSTEDEMPLPEKIAADYTQQMLKAARDNLTGLPPQSMWRIGIPWDRRHSADIWKKIQDWMASAPGDFQVETPAHNDYQCGYVSYTIKAHLSNNVILACRFLEQYVEDCEEVK